MHIITSKLNSTTFGTIGKATGVKVTAKAFGKKTFLFLNRLLRLSLNENLLL